MEIKKVTIVYFSPTKGTKKYLAGLAERILPDGTFEEIDLAVPEIRKREHTFGADELVIFGAPVYAGRLPGIEGGIFERVKGNHTPAVFNVSYGNREFEDALLEEKEICEKNGFCGIAAGAWIAPHTFSDRIAAGRPDEEDWRKTERFAEQVREMLREENPTGKTLLVPGNHPYRDGKTMPFHPKGSAKCTGCQACVRVCPVEAISKDHPRETDTGRCIDCLACVNACPAGARKVTGPVFKIAVSGLESKLSTRRKEAETFLAD